MCLAYWEKGLLGEEWGPLKGERAAQRGPAEVEVLLDCRFRSRAAHTSFSRLGFTLPITAKAEGTMWLIRLMDGGQEVARVCVHVCYVEVPVCVCVCEWITGRDRDNQTRC